MIEIKRSHLAAATAVPLVIVLIAVALVVTRGRPPAPAIPVSQETTDPEKPVKLRDKAGESAPAAGVETKLLAVSADGFDRINTSLDELGAGYRYEIIDDETLRDLAKLRRFEAVFLACADVGEPPENLPKVLHDYVTGGGTLYASDLRFDVLALTFPEVVDAASVAQGVPQDVRGAVTSPELRDLLGPEVLLQFKSERWRTAAFRGEDVSVLLKGQLKTTAGVTIEAPLAVRFPIGKGAVIFTSFHSEGRISDVESRLMKFLALKAVTSAAEVRLTESLADAGFTTRALAAVAADTGAPPRAHAVQLEKPSPLKIQLEPARTGAIFRLEVIDPDGKATTKEGESKLAIDLADAKAGRWQFRASVERAPYPSFPAVVLAATSGSSADSSSEKMNPALVVTGGNVRFEEINLGNKNVVKGSRPLRIAVSVPRFDDMGRLLDALGEGYRHTQVPEDTLITPPALDPYDVFFLTCNGWPARWGTPIRNTSTRPGLSQGRFRPEILEKIKQTLSRFVGRGGTLYVSDLQYGALARAFSDRIPSADFDTTRLPELEDAEKNWLKVVAPLADARTVTQTLDKLRLSDQLLAHRNELLAVIYTSSLARIDGAMIVADNLNTIQSRLEEFELPATEADCKAIFDTFSQRRTVISNSIRSRNKAKVNKALREITKADENLKRLRSQLLINYDGGSRQFVEAQVVDQGLQEAIGETIRLRFPDNAWKPARFNGNDVQVLIRGTYQSVKREQIEAPLLVKFRVGRGTVIFTSFHNEAQNSQQELQLLRYLVFSAVTAKEEALAQQTMLSGGFSPVRQGQVNHATGLDSITKKYQSETGDPLRFSLNFGGTGATLRLTLVAPGGQKYENEASGTLLVEATGAPSGEWLYTVAAVKVPYANFAYSVSIGKGAAAAAKPSH
jgi:hypothetical protein